MIDKERWQKIDSVYHAALERDAQVRGAYLDTACAGDDELRHEVDSLLFFDDEASQFIETPAIEFEAKARAADSHENSEELLVNSLGPYELVSVISRGSMGDVFQAIDTRLGRKVAIKVLAKEFTDDERIARFKQEARTTSTLSHSNIVTLYEVGELDGHHYIVTEFVEGQTLRQRISSAPNHQVPIEEILKVTTQILDALQAAHEAGVVHRDIKPENIMIRPDGVVKILDFGIAKLAAKEDPASADHMTTKTGIIMGTASYMSPEQARGQKVDQRADLFSLGTMLYEMLSGKRPFVGDTMADVMAAVLIKEPVALDELVPGLPPPLKRIVDRCLEKEPSRRFQSASDLAFSLNEAKPKESVTSNGSNRRHGPFSWFNGAALLSIVVLISVVLFVVFYNRNGLPSQPEQTVQQPKIARKPAAPAKFTTRLVWYDRNGNPVDNVGETAAYSGPALSPNGNSLVVSIESPGTKRDLWIFDLQSGNRRRLTEETVDELNPVWSPDGKWIIYTAETRGVRNVYRKLADGSGQAEALLESATTNNVEDVSHNGKLIVVNTGNRDQVEPSLAMLGLETKTLKAFHPTKAREDNGRFSPDDKWLLYRSYESGNSDIFIRGISPQNTAAAKSWRVSTGKGLNTSPFWRGDGREVFFLSNKTLMSASVEINGSNITLGEPVPLFKVDVEDTERRNRFVVSSDGQRFLVIVQEPSKD